MTLLLFCSRLKHSFYIWHKYCTKMYVTPLNYPQGNQNFDKYVKRIADAASILNGLKI